MDKVTTILYFKYLAFLVIGIIVGRITMAIQYEVMASSGDLKVTKKISKKSRAKKK